MIVLPVILPLAAAAVISVLRRSAGVQVVISVSVLVASTVAGMILVGRSVAEGVVVADVGGWPPPFGIALVADPFGAMLTTVASSIGVVAVVWSAISGEETHPFSLPAALVLVAGASGAFLTSDLFNLFVFLEVSLIASYVLVIVGRKHDQVQAAIIYVPINVLGSLLVLAGLALLYGAAGTLNMAELAARDDLVSVAAVPGVVLLVAFVLKAALPPLGAWLPATYPRCSPAVGALFAGLLTTLGVVALYRVYAIVYRSDPALTSVLLVVGGAGMIVGAFGALAGKTPGEVISFLVIAQVGLMVSALALGTEAALVAGVFFIIQDLPVKAGLFLASDQPGGRGPLRGQGWLFMILGLSLAGIPVLSGFAGKLAVLQQLVALNQFAVAGIVLATSVFVLIAVSRAGMDLVAQAPSTQKPGRSFPLLPAVATASFALATGVWPQWLFDLSADAAKVLSDPDLYVQAVLR